MATSWIGWLSGMTGTSRVHSVMNAFTVASYSAAVRPWGEIVIDGKKRGVSPPIKELSIPEGRHRIEIRNSDFPVYANDVDVGAGRKVSIAHSFGSP